MARPNRAATPKDYTAISIQGDRLYVQAINRVCESHHVNTGTKVRELLEREFGEEIERELAVLSGDTAYSSLTA